jgi:putative phosphoribosyl transferase
MKKAGVQETVIRIPTNGAFIEGNLVIPHKSKAIVVFAHGSGSSRFSTRNKLVAEEINENGISTLLIDLLTPEEERVDIVTAEFRFNIDLLARRLIDATKWLKKNPITKKMAIGYFGASTGAAAALIAAAKAPADIKAVFSRGGRPDLAAEHLSEVKTPTLLIVGGEDSEVLELNREAMKRIPAEEKLEIVPGATHLFEERGKLEVVARLAIDWFSKHLV